ncbi:MAG: hypothetical protein ACFFC7_16130 [Candidatus Hermodarchaeota archaeon]
MEGLTNKALKGSSKHSEAFPLLTVHDLCLIVEVDNFFDKKSVIKAVLALIWLISALSSLTTALHLLSEGKPFDLIVWLLSFIHIGTITIPLIGGFGISITLTGGGIVFGVVRIYQGRKSS